ncbi:LacI family DNA-binding transcriptional regulator [Aestuariivirga sp.]|uniref:LacI family DNA-binding transcriptional regulator n=1 Tax=Aestuariivirga sp. TaxID=2650926 RepID=UPI0039E639AB
MGKATIEDVAARAGVSVATVDRVLNARATVRPSNLKRVEAAIRALNYHPDRLAARLARGREYRFCFVLPEGDNVFMTGLEREIAAHTQHLAADRVIADVTHTDVFDAAQLARTLDGIEGYDGVAVVALDHPRVREAVNGLVARGTHVVTLVSDVPGASHSHFVGIDNSAAGRTAATLMGRFLGNRKGKVAVIAGALALRDHAERHFGFLQVLGQEHGHLQLLPVREERDSSPRAAQATRELLKQHPDLVGLYNVGAGTDGIITALREQKHRRDLVVIAHELTEASRAALIDGTLSAVIAQDPGHEIRSAMRVLMARCDRQPLIAAQERISIDIFLRDNLP